MPAHRRHSKRKAGSEKSSGGAAHAFWSGTITFGLVSVPVNLFPGNRGGGVHWRMLDQDGTPLRRRFFCPEDGKELNADELIRGYEIDDGEYVIVSDEELGALAPRKSRDIDVRAFVDADEVEPLYFERSYFLTPAGENNKAYRLLATLMEHQKQAGIATFVMHEKEYLVAIFSENGILRAETLHFEDEIRRPGDVGLTVHGKAQASRVAHMTREMNKIKEDKLNESLLVDEYSRRVQVLIKSKGRKHQQRLRVEASEEEEPGDIDLVAILKRSLAGGADRKQQKLRAGHHVAGTHRRRRIA